jgi:putative ABC transport system permease protein
VTRTRRWLREFRFPWRSNFDVRREVDEEIDFHLTLSAEDLERNGLDSAAARREAARKFGDVAATRRELASHGWRAERTSRAWAALQALYHDVSYALRSLRRNLKFAVVAALVLALGIGSSAAVFAVLDTVVLRPLPLREPGRLLTVGVQPPPDAQWTMQTVRLAVLKQWQANADSFERLDGYTTPQLTWRGPEGPERIVGGALVDDLFGVLGATMALGGAFIGGQHANAPAVLSDAFWRQRFNSRPDVVGEPLELDGSVYTIVGVLPPEAAAVLEPTALVWIALDRAIVAQGDVAVRVVGRLAPGVGADTAISQLAAMQRAVEQERGFTPPARGVVVRSVQQKRGELFGTTLIALFGGALLLVTIAAANVGTLMLTRLVERRHEFAVRASLGASRWRVGRQVLTEHVVLWAVGGGAGLVLGELALRAVARAYPLAAAATGAIAIDGRVILFALGVTLLTALVFGLLPALESAERNPVLSLREDGTAVSAVGRSRRWRRSLVVAQVALSTVLASGACLLALSLFNLTSQPLGFRPDELRTFRVQLPVRDYPNQSVRREFRQRLLAELRALPGVESVATTSAPPLGTIIVGPIGIEGDAIPDELLWAAMQAIDHDYFAAAGTALLVGRAFSAADDVNGERVAIVNAAFVTKYFDGRDPLDRRVALGSTGGEAQPLRIVGVVEDVKHAGLDYEYFPEIFMPYEQVADGPASLALGADIYAVLRVPDAFAPAESAVRSIVGRIDPDLPIMDLRTGAELVAWSAEGAEVRAGVMAGIAALAVLLSGVGLYAVLSQAVAQRRKELGIRMALGATSASLVQAVCRDGVALSALGVAGGALAALALAQYMRSLLYGVSAFEPLVLVGVTAFMLVVALLAAALPGWRATKLSPTLAIRSVQS